MTTSWYCRSAPPHSALAPAELRTNWDVPPANQVPGPTDVIAVWDGWGGRFLNVGIMWMRSTPGTRELSRRAENRTFSGWEQGVFNEEINFNKALKDVRCCHTSCLRKLLITSKVAKLLPGKDSKSKGIRAKAEGADRCTDDQPAAARPPKGSPELWAHGGRWKVHNDTLRNKHTSMRKFGRCNNDRNVCLHLQPEEGTVRRELRNCTAAAVSAAEAAEGARFAAANPANVSGNPEPLRPKG